MNASQPTRKVVLHPFTFALIAISIGALAGLGSYLATRSDGASAGSRPKVVQHKSKSKTPDGPKLPPSGSHLVFGATFPGSRLNTAVWATCYWYAQPKKGCGHFGDYPEQEWYLPSQDQVSGGALHLVAQPVATPGANAQGQPETYQCRSGVVTTQPSFNFTYGYVQVVARLPNGANTWPAIWMLPANTTFVLPEIDIVEVIGPQTNRPFVTFHPSSGPQESLVVNTATLSSGWHTFGLEWKPGSITWYIDGRAVFAVKDDVPNQPMYILANLAVTNVFQPLQLPSGCNASLSIRSVKVWQKASS